MRCPTLAELPPPPPGKTGWPWTAESEQLPETMPALSGAEGPSGGLWPRVSIVTPSYNQGQFIEETIRSILLQGYPELEYFIFDGGSTDGSVEIIKRYAPWLTYWTSEPDDGQSDVLKQGFERATGEIVAWLNSDDLYLPRAIHRAVSALAQQPDAALVYGLCEFVNAEGEFLQIYGRPRFVKELLLEGNTIPQPSTFIRRASMENVGGINPQLYYVMDYDLWIRISQTGQLYSIPEVLSRFRVHKESKTFSDVIKRWQEWEEVSTSYNLGGGAISQADLVEARRRTRARIAVRSFLQGEEFQAIAYFSRALTTGTWSRDALNSLARTILVTFSQAGYALNSENLHNLRQLLHKVEHARRARLLASRLTSLIHIKTVFQLAQSTNAPSAEIRRHLIWALWHDPRWFGNRGVLSIGTEVFLGHCFAGWLRRKIRILTSKCDLLAF